MEEAGTGSAHGFSFTIAVAFTLNMIIGSGFLTIPYAFHETGWILATFVLSTVTAFSTQGVWFILETMARADLLAQQDEPSESSSSIKANASSGGGYNSLQEPPTMTRLVETSSHSLLTGPKSFPSSSSSSFSSFDMGAVGVEDCDGGCPSHGACVGVRKFEIPELVEIFLGPLSRKIYTAVVGVYLYGTLWAYATVFANSFASQLPVSASPTTSYYLYLFLFACCVVPASLMELSEQVCVQVSLSVCRIVMLGAMIVTVWCADSYDVDAFGSAGAGTKSLNLPLWNPSKLYILLPIAAYANIFHHSIPALSQPVRNKSALARVFTASLLVSFSAYAALGIVLSTYFGEKTEVSSNQQWRSYVGLTDNEGNVPAYARLASFFIVLFPAFDVASAFPLNAITLGNNLMSTFFGQHYPRMEKSRFHRNLFRLIAVCPPILLASVESNLGKITDFTGLTGFALAFLFPALLSMFSERKLRESGIDPKTQYSNRFTRSGGQVASLVVGAALTLFVAGALLTFGGPP